MVGAGEGMLVLGVAILCAGVMAAGGEAATSVIVGMAHCPSCSTKGMDAEAAFRGLKVAIKCSNGTGGEYESKAVGDLDGTGAFAVALPADVDLPNQYCVAQLHSAASSAPCPGHEPSKVVPLSAAGEGTFVAVAGKKTTTRSAVSVAATPECASANICFPCRVFGRRPFYRRMKPFPDYGMPSPDYGMPTPGYYPAPVYGTPAPRCLCTPTPEPGCQCPTAPVYGTPMPEYYPPPSPTPVYGTPTPECPPEAPVYGTPTPVYGTPAPRCMCSPTLEAGCQCPTTAPTPVYGTPAPRCLCTPTPEPGCMCPTSASTPVYGTPMSQPPPPTPVYGTPAPRCRCTPTPEAGCMCPTSASTPVYGTPMSQPPPPPTPAYGTPPAPVYGAVPTPAEFPPGAAPELGTPSYTPPAYHH